MTETESKYRMRYRDWAPCDLDPEGKYAEEWDIADWFVVPNATVTPESDLCIKANFKTALYWFKEADPEENDFRVLQFRHWFAGSVSIIVFRPGTKLEEIFEEEMDGVDDYFEVWAMEEAEDEEITRQWENVVGGRYFLDVLKRRYYLDDEEVAFIRKLPYAERYELYANLVEEPTDFDSGEIFITLAVDPDVEFLLDHDEMLYRVKEIMERRRERLKERAEEIAKKNGHVLGEWRPYYPPPREEARLIAKCTRCSRQVVLQVHYRDHDPNDDITGEVVRDRCPRSEEKED